MEQAIKNLKLIPANSPSKEISHTTAALPDDEDAAILSSIIDRVRLAKGWNRLAQGKKNEQGKFIPGEQDAAILTWFEILTDAGVPRERWNDCYRSAQARRSEQRVSGQTVEGIIEPNDLVVEWIKIKNLHYELDKSHLLPENAAGACQSCFGTNKEEMPDGSVKDDCSHLPLTDEDIKERAEAKAKQIEFMREAMKQIGRPKPQLVKPKFVNIRMECNYCHRRVDSDGVMWKDGDVCGGFLAEDKPVCTGKFFEFKRAGSPFPNL